MFFLTQIQLERHYSQSSVHELLLKCILAVPLCMMTTLEAVLPVSYKEVSHCMQTILVQRGKKGDGKSFTSISIMKTLVFLFIGFFFWFHPLYTAYFKLISNQEYSKTYVFRFN